ncbi:MAG TPA: MFS transporter [Ktedonobacteraceae bacterium]|nr:MFS transporter [Ktedonobacteraceae bacterium]
MKLSRISIRGQLVLNILWFSLNAQSAALLAIIIPTQILLFVARGPVGNAEQATFLGWIITGASVISLSLPPLIGSLSDHTPGALGRRRPYILSGGLIIVLSTPFLAISENVFIFLAGLSLLLVGRNILTPAYQGLIPDNVPKEQRGAASGFVGGLTILGSVVSLALAALLLGGVNQDSYSKSMIRLGAGIYYIVTAIIILIGVLITVIGVREMPFIAGKRPSHESEENNIHRFSRWFTHTWIRPWRSRNFTLVFLTRTLIMTGLALFMTFIEYYFARVQHVQNFVQATAMVAILALGGGVISGLVFGVLSDRLRRRVPIVCISTLCMSLTSLAFVLFPSYLASWLWPLGVLFGLGYGAYTSVDWALSIDVLPSLKDAGKDLGLWNASGILPDVFAPLIGSFIIYIAASYGQTALGYRLVFSVATLILVVAAVSILWVREK